MSKNTLPEIEFVETGSCSGYRKPKMKVRNKHGVKVNSYNRKGKIQTMKKSYDEFTTGDRHCNSSGEMVYVDPENVNEQIRIAEIYSLDRIAEKQKVRRRRKKKTVIRRRQNEEDTRL